MAGLAAGRVGDARVCGSTVQSVVDYGLNGAEPRKWSSARGALKSPTPRLKAARYSANREYCTRKGGEGGGAADRAARTWAADANCWLLYSVYVGGTKVCRSGV